MLKCTYEKNVNFPDTFTYYLYSNRHISLCKAEIIPLLPHSKNHHEV